MDLGWFRRELWIAIGVAHAACGPEIGVAGTTGSDATDDSSSGNAPESSSDTSTSAPVDATDTTSSASTDADSTSGGPRLPDPPWCDVAPPADAIPPRPCDDPQPIEQIPGVDSGWIRCSDTQGKHRASAVECEIPDDAVGSCNLEIAEAPECMTDADCNAAPNGFCHESGGFFEPTSCGCSYACTSDDDCGEDQLCFCQGAFSRCIPAYCRTDDDCMDGYHCWDTGLAAACDTPFDACGASEDCTEPDTICTYQPDLCAYQCEPDPWATAGRPFLVEDQRRLAPLVPACGWGDRDRPQPDTDVEPSEAARGRLADHWAEAALAEHASVAGFARFALQLLGLGAPADLLDDTARAMSDEIEHARLCFALAQRYGGRAIGPGPIDTAGAVAGAVDALEIAELTIVEGCVAETLAAVDAAGALELARDPEVRRALERIAADEARHAALGWRFVAWVMDRTDDAGRARLASALSRGIAAARADLGRRGAERSHAPDLERHGLPCAADRTRWMHRALSEVIEPTARALMRRPCEACGAAPDA